MAFRPRHVKDANKKYCFNKASEIEVGVQRIAVLLPVEELAGQMLEVQELQKAGGGDVVEAGVEEAEL